MTEEEMLKIFEETQALLKGHFRLSSGLCSGQYFQCAKVLQYPWHAEAFGKDLAEKFQGEGITCVVGPAIGGIVIAQEVARALRVKSVFAERVDGKMQLRRGFELSPDDKVLLVEDVITTGGSVKEVADLLADQVEIVGIGSLVNRSTQDPDFGVPFKSLVHLQVETFAPEECPRCQKGEASVKPGSRPMPSGQ